MKKLILSTMVAAVAVFLASTAKAALALGMDSDFNCCSVNFAEAKSNGISFACIKATAQDEGFQNSVFASRMSAAHTALVYTIPYNRVCPSTNTPASEAAYFWSFASSSIKAGGYNLSPAVDIEDGLTGTYLKDGGGTQTLTEWCNQYQSDLAADALAADMKIEQITYVNVGLMCVFSGGNLGGYLWPANPCCSNDFQNGNPYTCAGCSSSDAWDGCNPTGTESWAIWQYAWDELIPGPTEHVDLDVSCTNITTMVSQLGITTVSPPSITTQPSSLTVVEGQNAPFTVVASGTAPLSYKWSFDGAAISGATASSYTVISAQSTNAGSYSVMVTNIVGTVTGSPAKLTVNIPPSITTQPSSDTVNQGQNAIFTVAASGTAPLHYQWTFGGGKLSGATNTSYTVTNAQNANAGSYAVVVTNVAGTVTSSSATLTVNSPPSITTQPANDNVNQGQNATFSVVALGTAPLGYQWTFDGGDVSGATASSYTVSNAQSINAGSYAVIVTNTFGAITSSVATLTVIFPPVISTQPAGELISVSNSVTFTVTLSQGTSPAYQWRKNGTAISGATLSSLTFSSVTWTNAGSYTVVITNVAGSVTSAVALLTVQQAVFAYTNGFETDKIGGLDNNYTDPNTNAANPFWGPVPPNLYVYPATNGVTPHGGTNMAGGTKGVRICQDYLNLVHRMNAGQTYYGNFMMDWWFYDPYGYTNVNATNFADYLAVAQYAPVSATNDFVTTTFTNYYQRMSLGAYNGTGYSVTNYQVRLMGATGGFNTNGWFNTTAVRTGGWHHGRFVLGIPVANNAPVQMFVDNMYTPVFTWTNSGGSYGFNLIELNANMGSATNGGYYDDLVFRTANDPWIAQQPSSLTNNPGTSATFTTVAVGTAYQWQFNSSAISGATSTSYTISDVATDNAGSYTCIITGTNGTVTTSAATLTVP